MHRWKDWFQWLHRYSKHIDYLSYFIFSAGLSLIFSMKKIVFLLVVLFVSSTQIFAEWTTYTGTVLVWELNKLITQYEWQLKSLQAENNVLRNEVAKAGIKIPLADFPTAPTWETTSSGVVTTESGATLWESGSTAWTGTKIKKVTKVPTPEVSTVSWEWNKALDRIEKEQGSRYRGFIAKITPDWSAIRNAYKLPATSTVAWYEFVKKWNDDHVFVAITTDNTLTGWIFDAKILYQYDTTTFARKLIGLFMYDKKAKYYVTKTGTNPFGWVPRTFVAQPVIASLWSTTTSTQTWAIATWTDTWSQAAAPSSVTLAEIEKAYSDKRYLSVISLSNSYLTSNTASYDLLRIRYRTYFIIGKYSESLTEIDKISKLGRLDKSVACDAQVIATYSKNQSLVNTYTSICKWK